MAFVHGKKTRLFADGYEITKFFNDFTYSAKAGIAETTIYGLGAKTFIGGLREGQIQAKGYWDTATSSPYLGTSSSSSSVPMSPQTAQDLEFIGQLGNAQNTCLTLSPSGAVAIGTRVLMSEAAETEYSISDPVSGVVATSATFEADSGTKSGVILVDPTAALPQSTPTSLPTSGNTFSDTGAAQAATGTTTGAQTVAGIISGAVLNMSATIAAGFFAAGQPRQLTLTSTSTGGGLNTFAYTGGSGTSTFTGVTLVSGTGGGTVATATTVTQVPYTSNQGAIFLLHSMGYGGVPLTGGAAPIYVLSGSFSSSDDNSTWTVIPGSSFTSPQLTTGPQSSNPPFGLYVTIPVGTPIQRLVRINIVTDYNPTCCSGFGNTAVSTLVSFSRQ